MKRRPIPMHAATRPLSAAALAAFLASACLLFAACAAAGGGGTTPAALSYEITIANPDEGLVHVTAGIDGLDESVRRLRLSFNRGFAFVKLEEPLLEGPVTARAGGAAAAVRRLSPYTWEVDTNGERRVRLEYTVPLRHRGIEEVIRAKDQYEFPYLASDHGLLVTATLMLAPQDASPEEILVRFSLPDGWDVIAPWPAAGPGAFRPENTRSLTHDLVAVGSWSRHDFEVGGFTGTVAFAPGQDDLERAAADPIERIVAAELDLFGLPPEGRHLFLFGRPDTPGAGGSPKTGSMTLTVEPRLVRHDLSFLHHLVAHEFHHTWAGSRFDAPDEMRWYNEGFTDYYSYVVICRLGLMSWESFAAKLGNMMAQCERNPHRGELSLADAGGGIFFKDSDANRLVYEGGMVLAAWLDMSIRARGGEPTLNDFMRALNNDSRWEKGKAAPGVADFMAALDSFADAGTVSAALSAVTKPYAFDPVAAFAAAGVNIERFESEPDMNLRANLDGTLVRDIDPAGVGARAGVEAGDRFLEINGRTVKTEGEVRAAWRAVTGGRIRLILENGNGRRTIDQPLPVITRFLVPAKSLHASERP